MRSGLSGLAPFRRPRFVAAGGGGFTPGWDSPVSVASVGDSIVETAGTLIEGVNLGQSTNRTVNGVLFTGSTTRNDLSSSFGAAGVYQGGVIGTAFEGMMDSFAWAGGAAGGTATITLTGLTTSSNYIIQIFNGDDRFQVTKDREQTFSIGGNTSVSCIATNPYSIIGRFTATGTTQVLTITDSSSDSNKQACGFQVRTA